MGGPSGVLCFSSWVALKDCIGWLKDTCQLRACEREQDMWSTALTEKRGAFSHYGLDGRYSRDEARGSETTRESRFWSIGYMSKTYHKDVPGSQVPRLFSASHSSEEVSASVSNVRLGYSKPRFSHKTCNEHMHTLLWPIPLTAP